MKAIFMVSFKRICLLTGIVTFLLSSPSYSCSRLLWNDNPNITMAARTFDFSHSLHDKLYINPRGMKMSGGSHKNPMKWVAQYGSVTTAITSWLMKQGPSFTLADGATDGINEKGLAVHTLFLDDTQFEKRNVSKPGVETLRWARYLLDNFATVNEALIGMDKIQMVPSAIGENQMNFHLAMEDETGNSAIIEYVGGKKNVYHGPDTTVLTNPPAYRAQIKNLKHYITFGGRTPIPGNIYSTDRFVRLKYFAQFLPDTPSETTAFSYLLSAIRTAASPYGAPYAGQGAFPTWWISISDVKKRIYHFSWMETPNIIHVTLDNLDFSKGSGMRQLNPRSLELFGNVNNNFKPI